MKPGQDLVDEGYQFIYYCGPVVINMVVEDMLEMVVLAIEAR